MQVAIISRDNSFHRLCRDAMASLPVNEWNIVAVKPPEALPPAHVYLWDWEPGPPVPEATPGAGFHLLAIGREEARDLLDRLSGPAVSLLLKPINPDALRAFLEQAALHAGCKDNTESRKLGALRRDRDAILDCLLSTSLRLQEYDQDRMNFLARAVHDFRTPLTAVNGYCGLLLSGQFGPLSAAQREVLDRTLHSVRRLGRLATALFQWSTGLRTDAQPEMREDDLAECCRQAFHEVRPQADEKNISCDMDFQPAGQPLSFDAAQLEQLLVNLLENSCKFTPRGGYIQVRGGPAFWERRAAAVSTDAVLIERRRASSARPNAYRVEVSDNGMGVRPEHLETIFREYTSYGGGSDRSGSGLGLAICRRIVAGHGGRIFAESGNKGVTFVFYLPFSAAIRGDAEHDDRRIHLVAETVSGERA